MLIGLNPQIQNPFMSFSSHTSVIPGLVVFTSVFVNVSYSKIGQPPPRLMCERSCWSTVGSGGQAEGRGAPGTMACAVVGWTDEGREGESEGP